MCYYECCVALGYTNFFKHSLSIQEMGRQSYVCTVCSEHFTLWIPLLCWKTCKSHLLSIIHTVGWPLIMHDLQGLSCWMGEYPKLLSNWASSSDKCMQPCPAIHVELKRRWEKNKPERKKKGSLNYIGVDYWKTEYNWRAQSLQYGLRCIVYDKIG